MMKPQGALDETQSDSLPKDLSWLYEAEGISVDEGIRACGGVDAYIGSLKLFLDTLEESANVIEGAYRDGDIRLFTVKVHALKSSARIIGAKEFSLRCQKMEDAGNAGDMEYISQGTDELLKDFRAYGPRLIRLVRDEEAGKDLPPVPPEMLADAYEALKELVPSMEYDGVEMVLSQLKEYALPESDAAKIKELEKSLRVYDWEEMENILGIG
jgi:HPt (histidine-containing phosphotransfer) domain-containing protein